MTSTTKKIGLTSPKVELPKKVESLKEQLKESKRQICLADKHIVLLEECLETMNKRIGILENYCEIQVKEIEAIKQWIRFKN